MSSESSGDQAGKHRKARFVYIACPWGPKGGGMFRVADYLIQAQKRTYASGALDADLRGLDTRGGGGAAFSLLVLAGSLAKIVAGKITGNLMGVHVNMAERLSVFRKGAILIVCRLLRIPVILHLHAAQMPQFYNRLAKPLKALTRWIFSLPSTCVVLGETARRFVIDQLKVPENRVEIIINGVPEPAHTRRRHSDNKTQRVLFVGNLSERKGVTDLLQALSFAGFDRSNLEVYLVGGGDVEGYRKKSSAMGLTDLVTLTGWANQKEVSSYMASADVLVLPSYDEGLPLVILEALANGVAVVCTPVGEIPTVMTHELNALFVEPGNVEALSGALHKVLRESSFRETLERNGRTLYQRTFSLDEFFNKVSNIYQLHFGLQRR